LANWDKKGEDNEQYFKSYVWDGDKLVEKFAIDFKKSKLGRAHQMRFGAYSLYGAVRPEVKDVSVASLQSIRK
jgi:selenium-binding protein 1